MKITLIATIAASLLLSPASAPAGWLDKLGFGNTVTNLPVPGAANLGGLTETQMAQGLKEALGKGVQNAVSQLGHAGGFLTNLNVKIPVPEKLRTVEKTLRAVGQDKLADDFVGTMNHAAEQAVPVAAGVFGDAIQQMSIADAQAILTGTNTAATDYFRRTTQTNLYAKFLPIVKQATDAAGVTAAYKKFVAAPADTSPFGSLAGSFMRQEAPDLDGYVTQKAMDGLFVMVADEEKRIRENPLARSTDLLQKVFGAVKK